MQNTHSFRNSFADPTAAHLGRATGKPPASRIRSKWVRRGQNSGDIMNDQANGFELGAVVILTATLLLGIALGLGLAAVL